MKVRDKFFETVYQKTKQGEDIVIVSSDLGAPSLDNFRKEFPNRFVNVGIAEQNSIAVAAGLQMAGKKVITYGLNPFPVTRAFDQIRNLVSSLNIPVTVTALNAGSCSADAGYTHVAIENMSLLNTLDNLPMFNPTDETIAELLVDEILEKPMPRYVQFDKQLEGNLYAKENISFDKGFVSNRMDSDVVIVTYGIMAAKCFVLASDIKVLDCFRIPFDEKSFMEELDGCRRIYTLEDGVIHGGIGSMVLELVHDNHIDIPIKRYGLRLQNGYPKVFANRDYLWKQEGLDVNLIMDEIKRGDAI